METLIDHLVLVAPSRDVGVKFVSERLGVTPQPGGKHERMGTHNALVKLNDRIYLEVIAIDPNAVSERPRWFGLDDLDPFEEPRLATWVVRTNDIQSIAARVSLGSVEPMSRGSLNWLITIPADGGMLMSGAVPALIQWLSDAHPTDRLQESGCELLALEIRHPNVEALNQILDKIGFASPLVHCLPTNDNAPSLRATIKTPHGIREL